MEKGTKGKRHFLRHVMSVILALCMVVGAVSIAGPVEVKAAEGPDFYCGAYDSQNPFAVSNL